MTVPIDADLLGSVEVFQDFSSPQCQDYKTFITSAFIKNGSTRTEASFGAPDVLSASGWQEAPPGPEYPNDDLSRSGYYVSGPGIRRRFLVGKESAGEYERIMGQPGSGFHQAMNSAAAINRNALALSSADRLGFSTRPSIPPPPPPPRCTAAPAPAPEPETGFMDDAELIDGSEFYPKGVASATSIGARLNAIGPPPEVSPAVAVAQEYEDFEDFPDALSEVCRLC